MESRAVTAVENNINAFAEAASESKRLLDRFVKHLAEKDSDFLKENGEKILQLAKNAVSNVLEIQSTAVAVQACETRVRENVQTQMDGNAAQPLNLTTLLDSEMQTAQAKQKSLESDSVFRSVNDAVQKVSTAGSEEMMVTQTELQRVCPITKKGLVDPVRNKRCGHVYDREAVRSLMETNHILRCPVVGCGNTKTLCWADLETHSQLKEQLEAEKQKSSTSSNAGRKRRA